MTLLIDVLSDQANYNLQQDTLIMGTPQLFIRTLVSLLTKRLID